MLLVESVGVPDGACAWRAREVGTFVEGWSELELASPGRQAEAGPVHPNRADDLLPMAMTSVTQSPGS